MAELNPTTSPPNDNPALPLDYHRPPRNPFTTRVVDVLKTMAWVAPLTVLIWIYAEREQTETRSNVVVPIEVSINAPDRIVSVKDPPDRNVVVTLIGPRNGVQRAYEGIQSASGGRALVQVTLDAKIPSGEQPISNTASLVAANPIFLQNGVSIRDISPKFLRVQVDDMKEQELPIVPTGEVKNLVGVPIFTPDRVKVRAPESLFKLAATQNKLHVVADLSKVDQLKQPGKQEARVPVTWVFEGENVTILPRTVTVACDVSRKDAETVLSSVPIYIAPSPSFKYKAELRPNVNSIPNIHVVGPQAAIDQLIDGTFKPLAFLIVTNDDVRAGLGKEQTKELEFGRLPEGVHVTNDKSQITVPFTVTGTE
jgi:hypothetical protein